MAPQILKTLLLISIPLLLFLIGKTTHQVTCVLISFLRLSGDALSFYRSLTRTQQTNILRLFHIFRAQYAHNPDVLKAKEVKVLRQQPGQTIPAFF